MLEAEELGITGGDTAHFFEANDPKVQRITGHTAANIIQQAGNCAESYERNIGASRRSSFRRGLNALWTQGGLMYPLPLR